MADLRDAFPFILEECPGAPEPAMLRAVRSAAIELLRESRVLTQWLDPITLAADTPDYEIELEDGYQFVAAKEVKIDGVSRTDVEVTLTDIEGAQAVKVYPTPSVAASLAIRAVLAPSYESLELRDDIFTTYVEGIAAGARARLQSQPGKPWSNPSFSTLNQARFVASKNLARVRANRDGAAELMVRMRSI
jgi:hypothetical protein